MPQLSTTSGTLPGAWATAACILLCGVPVESASGKCHRATEWHQGWGGTMFPVRAMPQMSSASERVGITLATPQPWARGGGKISEPERPSPVKLLPQ